MFKGIIERFLNETVDEISKGTDVEIPKGFQDTARNCCSNSKGFANEVSQEICEVIHVSIAELITEGITEGILIGISGEIAGWIKIK